MYRIAFVRLFVHDRIEPSPDADAAAADSCSLASCVVLTVELRERAAYARSAAARCAVGTAMSRSPRGECNEVVVEPSLSIEARGNKADIFPRWTFVSTNAEVVESMLPFDRTDAPSNSCRIRPA